MFKRVALFLLTNVLVLVTLSIIWTVFGLDAPMSRNGINLPLLLLSSAIIGFAGAFISLGMSKVIAKWTTGMVVIKPGEARTEEERWLVATVQALSQKAGLPKVPEIGIWDSPEVNAFATGPSKKNSLVAVSTGILRVMERDEIEAVLAHEVAHIANGDMITMTLLQGVINTFVVFFARIIAWFASRFVSENLSGIVYFIVSIGMQIVFSILGNILVCYYSRKREFRADAGAAFYTDPAKMRRALEKLRSHQGNVDAGQPSLATAKIAGHKAWSKAFMTHPPLEDRIAALK